MTRRTMIKGVSDFVVLISSLALLNACGGSGSTPPPPPPPPPPPAIHFLVSGPANADSGVGFSLTIAALDDSSNAVTTYSGKVHFTSTDPHAQLPPDATLV